MADNEEQEAVQVMATGPQKRISDTYRFFLLAIGFVSSIVSSFSYAFNLISGEFQTRYDLSMTDMATMTTVGGVLGYFVLPWSFLYDYFGPTSIMIPAFVLFLTGQILLTLCFNGAVAGSVVRLSVFYAMAFMGFALYETVGSVTMIGHFPVHKGQVVGLMKTYLGLGSAIVGTIQLGFFAGQPEQYYYFLTALGAAIGVPLLIFMRHPPYLLTGYQMSHMSPETKQERLATKTQYLQQKPPMASFIYAFVILFILIIYLTVQGIVSAYAHVNTTVKQAFAIVTILIIALSYLVIPITFFCSRKAARKERAMELAAEPYGEEREEVQLSELKEEQDGTEEGEGPKKRVETELDYLAPQYQTSFLRNLLTLRLWCLFWAVFVTVGPELTITYNATYVYIAIAQKDQTAEIRTLLSVLNGAGSALGRLTMAYFEHWSQKKPADQRISITYSMFIPIATVIIALILFLTVPDSALPAAFVINSYGNGFLNAVMILVPRIIYAKDAAKHYHVCFFGNSMGILIFNRFVFAEWYSKEAKKAGSNKVCYGRKCVMVPLIIMVCITATGFLAAAYLHFSYIRFTKRVLAERARMLEETQSTPGTNDAEEVIEAVELQDKKQ